LTNCRLLSKIELPSGKPQLLSKGAIIDYCQKNNYRQFGKISEVWLGVPLRVKGNVTGVIALQNYYDPFAYQEEDVRLLCTVSDQVALAIELKVKEDSLKKSEQRFRNLVERIREVIYLTDEQGNIAYISPAAETLIGLTSSALAGEFGYFRFRNQKISDKRQGIDRFIHPDDRSTVAKTIEAALKQTVPDRIQTMSFEWNFKVGF
jgi:PAS domain-containing protein